MTKKPKILISNDDGIHAPGIKALWNLLKEFSNPVVIAPHHEQSGVALSITIRQPLRIEKHHWDEGYPVWSISGTPADCIKLGMNVLLNEKPDMIITGINRGSNAGRNLYYSGTVAGAIEGGIQGIPSIAFSCCDDKTPNYDQTLPFIIPVIQHFLEHPLPQTTILNVNFPHSSTGAIKGLKLARQGKGGTWENPDCRTHPSEGKSYYWLGSRELEENEHPDSDILLLKQGYATAVPIQIGELTDHHQLRLRKERFEALFNK